MSRVIQRADLREVAKSVLRSLDVKEPQEYELDPLDQAKEYQLWRDFGNSSETSKQENGRKRWIGQTLTALFSDFGVFLNRAVIATAVVVIAVNLCR
jgi:hypothetical protein